MDLSRNIVSRTIPHCFHHINFGKINLIDLAFSDIDTAIHIFFTIELENATYVSLLEKIDFPNNIINHTVIELLGLISL